MIQWNEKTLENEESVALILALANNEWEARKKLYERIVRKLNDGDLVEFSDERLKVPLEYYINSMVTGYFAGKAPVYDVERKVDDNKLTIFEKIFKKISKKEKDTNYYEELKEIINIISKYNNDSTEFFDLAFDYFGLRGCYEIIYENNANEIVYSKQSSLNTIGIFDYSTPVKQIGQLRSWSEKDDNNSDITIVELTTVNGKKFYTPTPEDVKKLRELQDRRENGKWDMLPCIAIENELNLSCFELVVSLINAYERVIQNSRNTFKYNDEAKLKVVGYEPEHDLLRTKQKNGLPVYDEDGNTILEENPARKLEDETLLKMKVFYTPSKEGDISWIEKQVQDTALQNHKKTLIDLIAMITGVPNITDLGFTTADNASALDRKFFALEQMITDADKHFKEGILRRWQTILSRLNKKMKKDYDFRNIKVDLIRNLPTDKDTETNRALKLRGLISDESVISMLPDNFDATSEITKMKKQNEDNIEANLKAITKTSKNTDNERFSIEEKSNSNKKEEKETKTDKNEKKLKS